MFYIKNSIATQANKGNWCLTGVGRGVYFAPASARSITISFWYHILCSTVVYQEVVFNGKDRWICVCYKIFFFQIHIAKARYNSEFWRCCLLSKLLYMYRQFCQSEFIIQATSTTCWVDMLFVYHNQCTDVFEKENDLANFHQRKEGQRKQKTLSTKSGLLH